MMGLDLRSGVRGAIRPRLQIASLAAIGTALIEMFSRAAGNPGIGATSFGESPDGNRTGQGGRSYHTWVHARQVGNFPGRVFAMLGHI
jgi:hypothetical protein